MTHSATVTQSKTQASARPFYLRWQTLLAGGCLSLAALFTAINSPLLVQWEREIQTLFFELRGPRAAPDDIVILAIDNESLSQVEHYRSDPVQYADLEPIQQWPWQREAYAIVIERLLAAGAKAVSLDIILATDSAYGPADDDRLTQVLEQYGDRVTLAMVYGENQTRQGMTFQPTLPLAKFQQTGIHLGNINFPLEADGRIHRQGHTYFEELARSPLVETFGDDSAAPLAAQQSFAEATLAAAQVSWPADRGKGIQFHGPVNTFTHIPFWYVLDRDPWENYLDSGAALQDKIVLIGTTSEVHQDFHNVPFAQSAGYPLKMPGVEILANDIATLQAGSAIQTLVPNPWGRAAFTLVAGTGLLLLLVRRDRTLYRVMWTAIAGAGWLLISFVSFAGFGVFLPIASVTLALVTTGGCYSVASLMSEQMRKQRFRQTLAQYATSPIVQEIISQEEDFQDLLEARQAEVVGTILAARYQVQAVLGAGGFSETYTAADTQRPGHPLCVVKRLRILSDDPKSHQLAHRLFVAEAQTLERLGHHNQIPRLLAHFQTGVSFYLVEELIEGNMLKDELSSRHPKSAAWVMNFLLDILPVVEFVHQQGVIHRDIKPSNLIRRAGDGRLVLIDFGSVKELPQQLAETEPHVTSTIGIGTKGYMPSEQSAGMPRFSSDLYAIGITAIEALIGISPYKLQYDDRGNVIWQYCVPELHPTLAAVISKMVCYDFSQRYESATAVLAALREIPVTLPDTALIRNSIPLEMSPQGTEDDEDCWDEPTGYLPTDWAADTEQDSRVK
ncbi:serine/threonine-protein kinase [Halomicronema sp. CCY15110]|uniref:serine/threonine-protein kinase n=1 Tax=Halomicronema sp. CCY15110 TaxID=2767773 RepID=UPI0019529D2B|nr:serine/threonine-protein kinase [Halomicronema sp. CCY15110]